MHGKRQGRQAWPSQQSQRRRYSWLARGIVLVLAWLLALPAWCTQTIYYVHSDHLGTPQVLTDQGGNVVWQTDYTPFGQTPSPPSTGSVTFNIRFPGQYYDKYQDNSYNYYRDYDAGTGRYIESDPIGLQGGLNTYGYTLQNPLMYLDPYGLYCLSPEQINAISGAVGGGVGGAVTGGLIGIKAGPEGAIAGAIGFGIAGAGAGLGAGSAEGALGHSAAGAIGGMPGGVQGIASGGAGGGVLSLFGDGAVSGTAGGTLGGLSGGYVGAIGGAAGAVAAYVTKKWLTDHNDCNKCDKKSTGT